jgi:hypothetical protein
MPGVLLELPLAARDVGEPARLPVDDAADGRGAQPRHGRVGPPGGFRADRGDNREQIRDEYEVGCTEDSTVPFMSF